MLNILVLHLYDKNILGCESYKPDLFLEVLKARDPRSWIQLMQGLMTLSTRGAPLTAAVVLLTQQKVQMGSLEPGL